MIRLSAVLFLTLGLLSCGPLDIDLLIEINPPEWTEIDDGALCSLEETRGGDVRASTINEQALKGVCLIIGDVTIDADLDTSKTALAKVREIQGNLTIEAGHSGGVLVSLERLTGVLTVFGETMRLDGQSAGRLEKLQYIGELEVANTDVGALAGLSGLKEIDGNARLSNLSGATFPALSSLTQIRNEFIIQRVPSYTGKEALPALKSVGSLNFRELSGLKALELPSSFKVPTSLTFSDCEFLESINVPGIREADLRLFRNKELVSLSMPELETIPGTLQVINNPKLRNLTLPKLTNVPPRAGICGNSPDLQEELDALQARLGEKMFTWNQNAHCPW